MPSIDISVVRPLGILKSDNSVPFADRELSIELVNACHIEFADIQDKYLSYMYAT